MTSFLNFSFDVLVIFNFFKILNFYFYYFVEQGLGVVCNKEGGFSDDDFVVEFLGEVRPKVSSGDKFCSMAVICLDDPCTGIGELGGYSIL